MKPVVCRRVVGRLPPSPRKKWWFYLVRSLGFHPSLPLTTGTFNLVVKEPNRLPPERRAFSPMRRHTSATPPVLETCTSYLLPALTVNPLQQWDFHCFSTLETSSHLSALSSRRTFGARNGPLPPHKHQCPFGTRLVQHERRRKLITWKKTLIGGSSRKTLKPFEELCPRMNAPWPEPICRINLYLLRCWTSDESFDKFVQLATHTALGEFFIPDASRRAQGGGFTAAFFCRAMV